ncbi:MAG: hypothetical protein IT215_05935 [Chitinophagaceae bacterium]|nr:hypothetical protein [Chitinophagaceae bacterium]
MEQNIFKKYLKETYDFLIELIKSPKQTLQKKHELSWAQIFTYFSITCFSIQLVSVVLSGDFYNIISTPLGATVAMVLGQTILFVIATVILDLNKVQINKLELGQVWLKGSLFAVIAMGITDLIQTPIFNGLGLILSLIPPLCIAYSIYLYYENLEAPANVNSKMIAGVVGGIFVFLMLSSTGMMNWGVGRFLSSGSGFSSSTSFAGHTSSSGNNDPLVSKDFNKLVKKFAKDNEAKRRALEQYGYSLSTVLTDLPARDILELQSAARSCLRAVFGNDDEIEEITIELKKLFFDSREKVKKWHAFNEALSGTFIPGGPYAKEEQRALCVN